MLDFHLTLDRARHRPAGREYDIRAILASGPRFVPALHKLLVRTSGTPLARVWRLAYRAAARAGAAYLARGERAPTTYLRGSLMGPDFIPGLSDIDIAVVLAEDPTGPGVARARASRRWQRLRRAVPAADLLLDYPRIYEEPELAELNGASVLTYGLDGAHRSRPAGYLQGTAGVDRGRGLERPGLYEATAGWRLMHGPERRPAELPRDPQARRIAAWLELVYWWRWAFSVCADPQRPRSAHLCVKLVAEPARIWLWLAHGERFSERTTALRRALERLPEEERALRAAIDLHRSLSEEPDPPLAEVLPALVRLSRRIAGLIGEEVRSAGATEVRLAGRPAELILPQGSWRRAVPPLDGVHDPPLLPLCDWRGLVSPGRPDETLALLSGDPADPALLGAAASSQGPGPRPAIHADGLIALPGTQSRTRLRALQCRVTDPVSFALAEGQGVARFPDVRGWSAMDSAQRAVAEHRACLADRGGWADQDCGGDRLGLLLTAARAALFLETIDAGEPELALTVVETARQLGARFSGAGAIAEEALERYRGFAARRTSPPPATVAELRELVLGLPAYAGFAPRSRTRTPT